jgi:hypothetical protein
LIIRNKKYISINTVLKRYPKTYLHDVVLVRYRTRHLQINSPAFQYTTTHWRVKETNNQISLSIIRAYGLKQYIITWTQSVTFKLVKFYGIIKKDKEWHPPFAATFGMSFPPYATLDYYFFRILFLLSLSTIRYRNGLMFTRVDMH